MHGIITLISIATLLIGTLALAGSSCSAVDLVSGSWQAMTQQTGHMARTRISWEDVSVDLGRDNVRVTLKNQGQTSLSQFSRWDIIVQYYGKKVQGVNPYFIKRLSFTTQDPPGNDQWRVEGIFQDAQTSKPESFGPNIFNPAEELKIHMKLDPKIGTKTTNWAIVSTPNGVAISVIFTGPAG